MHSMNTNPTSNLIKSTDDDTCRRCKSAEAVVLINKKRHRRFIVEINSADWERGYTEAGAPLDGKAKATGPYCRECAEKRVEEFRGKDDRAQRYADAKRLRNVGNNDCPLIAAQALTGLHRREIEKVARTMGWRHEQDSRGERSLITPQVRRLFERLGVRFASELNSMDGVIDSSRWSTLNEMKRCKVEGTWAVVTRSPRSSGGHVVTYRDGEVLNGDEEHDRRWKIFQAWKVA